MRTANSQTVGPCLDCGEYDWQLDEKTGQWVCAHCSVAGKPKAQKPPAMDVTDFDPWHEAVMQEYNIALRDWAELYDRQDGDITEVERLIRLAMIKAAETRRDRACGVATIASAIAQIKELHNSGDIYVKVDGIEKRFKW